MSTATVRLAHLSDIHVRVPRARWRPRDLLSKRITGVLNNYMGRRARAFRQADIVLTALMADLQTQAIDHVVFTGDACTLGFAEECRHAANLLGVGSHQTGIAVPGNHDLYTRASAFERHFESCFAPWQQGVRIDENTYPFAQKVGPLWLVGVNSARGNLLPWDASGLVGPEQCRRLAILLTQLDEGPRILVTHYPVVSPCDQPERLYHRLRDMAAVVPIAREGGIALWLHGHCHLPYHLSRTTVASFPTIGAGSATQAGLASYGVYTITGTELQASRRAYDPATNRFSEAEMFALTLRTNA